MSKTTKYILIGAAIVIGIPVLVVASLMIKDMSAVRRTVMTSGQVGLLSETFGMDQPKATGLPSGGERLMAPNMSPSDAAMPRETIVAQPPTVDNKTTPRLIIKNGTVSLVVKDVPNTLGSIKTYAESIGGFVVESNTYKSGSIPYGVITIRIPARVFEAGVGSIKALGEVVSEDIRGSDVTAEYVDLESQLKNLRASEQQFLEIMKRAGAITEVLAVQNELTQVRGQIEGIQGRMKYLKESSEMSSLTINLSTDPGALPIVENNSSQWKPLVVIKDALRSLLEVGKRLVNALIWIVIFSPVWGACVAVVWWLYRRSHKKSSR